jgi:hypothetical protein
LEYTDNCILSGRSQPHRITTLSTTKISSGGSVKFWYMSTAAAAAGHYVSSHGAERVLKYKYSGSDKSLLYNYFISPLAQRIVDICYPEWLAPNTITITGLLLVVSSHVLLAFYSPNLDSPAPSYVYAYAAFCLFVYQVLDVTDGKQARKTGNSSPLGLLFDHGCDALNTVFSACNMASCMLMGPTYMVRMRTWKDEDYIYIYNKCHGFLTSRGLFVVVFWVARRTLQCLFHGDVGRVLYRYTCVGYYQWSEWRTGHHVLYIRSHGVHRTCHMDGGKAWDTYTHPHTVCLPVYLTFLFMMTLNIYIYIYNISWYGYLACGSHQSCFRQSAITFCFSRPRVQVP